MKINADIVLKARKQKFWSQEELAIASGLNLRTIQRIEREASASLQSRKGSCIGIGLASRTSTIRNPYRQEWEYRVVETKASNSTQRNGQRRAGGGHWYRDCVSPVEPKSSYGASNVPCLSEHASKEGIVSVLVGALLAFAGGCLPRTTVDRDRPSIPP